jgi:hypothetical protein
MSIGRSAHLQAMGIEQWVRRELPQATRQEGPQESSQKAQQKAPQERLQETRQETRQEPLHEPLHESRQEPLSPQSLQPGAVQAAVAGFSKRVTLQGAPGSALMLITPPLQAEAEQLLVAMLGAINVDIDDCYRLSVSDPALFSDPGFAPFLQQQVADSGSRLQLQLGAAAPLLESLFHCADPAHLLAHPEEKRGAWEVLKRLRHQLQQ